LFTSKTTHFELAKAYQSYLIEQHGLQLAYDNTPKLFLDVVGALTLEERFLGIPYDRSQSMTSYNQLLTILQDLEGIPTVLNYQGVFNGGLHNSIGNKAELLKANGSNKELEQLMNYAASNNHEL